MLITFPTNLANLNNKISPTKIISATIIDVILRENVIRIPSFLRLFTLLY
jgi:hypothetical protein